MGKCLGIRFRQEISTELSINLTLNSSRWQLNGLFGWVCHLIKYIKPTFHVLGIANLFWGAREYDSRNEQLGKVLKLVNEKFCDLMKSHKCLEQIKKTFLVKRGGFVQWKKKCRLANLSICRWHTLGSGPWRGKKISDYDNCFNQDSNGKLVLNCKIYEFVKWNFMNEIPCCWHHDIHSVISSVFCKLTKTKHKLGKRRAVASWGINEKIRLM